MICENCHLEKDDKDFTIPNICYKCLYQSKIKDKFKKVKVCRVCENPLPKGKRVCCSPKCQYIDKMLYNHKYWVNKCKSPTLLQSWKGSKRQTG